MFSSNPNNNFYFNKLYKTINNYNTMGKVKLTVKNSFIIQNCEGTTRKQNFIYFQGKACFTFKAKHKFKLFQMELNKKYQEQLKGKTTKLNFLINTSNSFHAAIKKVKMKQNIESINFQETKATHWQSIHLNA